MIRKATIWDAHEITNLWALMMDETEFYSGRARNWHKNESFLLSLIVKIKNPNYIILVAEKDNKIIGFIHSSVENVPYLNELKVHCHHIYVLPEFRNKKIAHLLSDESIEISLDMNISGIEFTTIYDEKTIKAWERKGYKPLQIIYRKEV